ncbi:MAG: hypothetical protein ACTTJK_07805 [Phocaeicola sp.]|uniref:hypothetical protein n=1 Tax=Phocaeicola sp. TaxID=2773926 RepID=UPI003FA180C1
MKKILYALFLILMFPVCSIAQEEEEELFPTVRGVIFDTDWWTDVDDAVALRVLLKEDEADVVELNGIVIDAVGPLSVVSLDRFLSHEGLDGMTIGIDKYATDYTGKPAYHTVCIKNTEQSTYLSNSDAEDCVSYYRRTLVLVPDEEQIDIICVGYPNALSRLLDSKADSISKLNGVALVKSKVRRIWMMAGNYPNGKENNFARTARSRKAGANVCLKCPVPIYFLGYNVGVGIYAGGGFQPDDLLYKILYAHGGKREAEKGRSAWGAMLTHLACIGDPEEAGYDVVRGTNRVNPVTGANTFTPSATGKHYYVKKKKPNLWYQLRLEELLH